MTCTELPIINRMATLRFTQLHSLPMTVQKYLHELIAVVERHYGGELYGVYLHGSAAFGHFIAASSDLDLLIVVKRDSHLDKNLYDHLVRMSQPAEVLGLELSVLTRDDVLARSLARPFRSHFWISTDEQRFVNGADHPGDSDLVLHFAVCNSNGIAILGPPASEAFPAPERREILEALVGELEGAKDNGGWINAVLNATRAWRYVEESVMSSKLSGWLWARERVPAGQFLDHALTVYLTPRNDHQTPKAEFPGFDEWAQDLLGNVLDRLHSSIS